MISQWPVPLTVGIPWWGPSIPKKAWHQGWLWEILFIPNEKFKYLRISVQHAWPCQNMMDVPDKWLRKSPQKSIRLHNHLHSIWIMILSYFLVQILICLCLWYFWLYLTLSVIFLNFIWPCLWYFWTLSGFFCVMSKLFGKRETPGQATEQNSDPVLILHEFWKVFTLGFQAHSCTRY